MRVLRESCTIAGQREAMFSVLEDIKMSDRLNPEFLRTRVERGPWLPNPGERTACTLTLRGVPFAFETELTEYRRGFFLLERQVAGPFASYEHAASLEDVEDGTKVTEVVAYSLPFRVLGRLFDRLAVRADLEEIVRHRQRRLRELFQT